MAAQRIVSLLPSGTEILCALGLRDRLVGVSHECDYPAGVADLPQVTSSILKHGLSAAEIDAAVSAASLERRPLYAVDGDLLNRLEPDLIVTQGVCAVCAVTEETVATSLQFATVEATADAQVLSLGGTDRAGVRRDLLAVGRAAGVVDEAVALVGRFDAAWARLPGPNPAGPRVLMLEWPDPPWSGGHWVPEQVAAAGGVDPFAAPGANSRRLTWDEVQQEDPEVLVVMACGFDLQRNLEHARKLLADPARTGLRAVREGNVWAADANGYFSRPGPRILGGAELLADLLAGREPPPERAQRA